MTPCCWLRARAEFCPWGSCCELFPEHKAGEILISQDFGLLIPQTHIVHRYRAGHTSHLAACDRVTAGFMFTEGFVFFAVLQEQLAWDDEIIMSLPLFFSPSSSFLLALGPLRLPQPFARDLLKAVVSE